MLDFLTTTSAILWFGITGCLAIVIGCLSSGLVYTGKLGERYSLLNHFISELGEKGVSRLAWLFNLGLMTGGLLLFFECIGLGLRIPGIFSKLGMVAGCGACIAVILVGVFPMNHLTPHIRAAMTFFRLGLVTILLFTIGILFQPLESLVVPRITGLAGIPSVLAYALFLVYSARKFSTSADALTPLSQARPRLWKLAFLEWLIFVTTIPWFLGVAILT